MAAQAQPIPISKLSPQQLSSLHQSLQIELRNNEQQLEALYQVQDQYMNNKAIVQNLGTPKVQGKPMLVPLNASMYVTGEIESYERVIIDVGANYFISKVCKRSNTRHTLTSTRNYQQLLISMIEK